MTNEPQRKRLIVADMIIAGERKGPMSPTAKRVGAIAVGEDPVSFDESIAALMGANVSRIPTLRNARKAIGSLPLTDMNEPATILSNVEAWNGKSYAEIPYESTWKFRPIDSWKEAFGTNDGE